MTGLASIGSDGPVRRAKGRWDVGFRAGPSDHVCWGYSSEAERAAVAEHWLRDGLRIGQRALYVADAPPTELLDEVTAGPELSAAYESGALAVAPATDVYDLSAPIDAGAQLATNAAIVDQALASGYNGVRVAADITRLVAAPERRPAHLHWEQFADRYIAGHPLAPMCMYDTRRITEVTAIACVHHLQGPIEAPFALYGRDGRTAMLAGEVDAMSAAVLGQIVQALPDADEAVDVSRLSFIDARGAWTLFHGLLERWDRGRRSICLTEASRPLRRMWDILGFDPALLAAA